MRAALDYATWPLLVVASLLLPLALLDRGVPPLLVTPIGVAVFAGVTVLLERVRPERAEHRELDRPIVVEALHFLFSFELGYGIALGVCELLARGARAALPLPTWPTEWPLALQMLVAIAVYEGTSYWQHRAIHRWQPFFRFHALHHSGARLNFVRAVRFHAVDIGTAAFVSYLPLVLLGAPERLFTSMGVLLSVLGILQHANIRMRTPSWLDAIVCTPAIHRHHHSIVRAENDTNFGNTVMVFDHLFGTYGRPDPVGPKETGLHDDPVPEGFVAQVVSPFRSARTRSVD